MQQVYKNILKEIRIAANKTNALRQKADIKKQKAMLDYKKYQLIKEKKLVEEVNRQLDNLASSLKASLKFEDIFKQLFNEFTQNTPNPSQIHRQHFKNVQDFLTSQRTYQELLERYNPGLTMQQDEKIEKSAGRVGLKVPE